jgi:hypothetical protein
MAAAEWICRMGKKKMEGGDVSRSPRVSTWRNLFFGGGEEVCWGIDGLPQKERKEGGRRRLDGRSFVFR